MAKGLGKGINALFVNMDVGTEETVREIELKEIMPIHINLVKYSHLRRLRN